MDSRFLHNNLLNAVNNDSEKSILHPRSTIISPREIITKRSFFGNMGCNTILNKTKAEVLKLIQNESRLVRDFIAEYNGNLLELYEQLNNLNLTPGKRVAVKRWLEKHGAQYLSLKILSTHRWIKVIDSGSFSTAHLVKSSINQLFYVVKITKEQHTKTAMREVELLTNVDNPIYS